MHLSYGAPNEALMDDVRRGASVRTTEMSSFWTLLGCKMRPRVGWCRLVGGNNDKEGGVYHESHPPKLAAEKSRQLRMP